MVWCVCVCVQYANDVFYGSYRPQAVDHTSVLIFTHARLLELRGAVRAATGTDDVVGLLLSVVESVTGTGGSGDIAEVLWSNVMGIDVVQGSGAVRVLTKDGSPPLVVRTVSPQAAATLAETIEKARQEAAWVA